jgi:membrane protease YdiL (CAAX protease family)
MQSGARFSALELVEAGLLLVTLTTIFGIGLSPLNSCLGGGGGFTCYPDMQGFLGGFVGLMAIVLGEELFFRAYLITELNQVLGTGALAVIVATLVYTLAHLPALLVEGFGEVSALDLLQIIIGALTLSACYWYTGRNLAAVVLLHAYWDGVGALVFIPNVAMYGPILLILGQLSFPAAILVIIHRLWSHFSGPALPISQRQTGVVTRSRSLPSNHLREP